MKIHIENYGVKVTVDLPEDATIDQVMDAIIGMLKTLTYHGIPEAIRDYLDTNYPENT